MNYYKLKLLAEDENETLVLLDLYLDVEAIEGFFIPIQDAKIKGESVESIIILLKGSELSVLQEDHIVKFLKNKFYKDCITA